MSNESEQPNPIIPKQQHIHKWIKEKTKEYKSVSSSNPNWAKDAKIVNPHTVKKVFYKCKTCDQTKIEKFSPTMIDNEDQRVRN